MGRRRNSNDCMHEVAPGRDLIGTLERCIVHLVLFPFPRSKMQKLKMLTASNFTRGNFRFTVSAVIASRSIWYRFQGRIGEFFTNIILSNFSNCKVSSDCYSKNGTGIQINYGNDKSKLGIFVYLFVARGNWRPLVSAEIWTNLSWNKYDWSRMWKYFFFKLNNLHLGRLKKNWKLLVLKFFFPYILIISLDYCNRNLEIMNVQVPLQLDNYFFRAWMYTFHNEKVKSHRNISVPPVSSFSRHS